MTGPTAGLLEHWDSLEIRLMVPPGFSALHNADFAALERRVAKEACRECEVCGELVIDWSLSAHCRRKGDPNHLALEVMES